MRVTRKDRSEERDETNPKKEKEKKNPIRESYQEVVSVSRLSPSLIFSSSDVVVVVVVVVVDVYMVDCWWNRV